MNRFDGKINVLLVGLGSWIGSYWATMPSICTTLVFLMIVDFSVGVMSALWLGTFSGRKAFWGPLRKVVMFAVVVVAHEISKPLNIGGDISTAVAFFYCFSELRSVFKNFKKFNVDIPSVFTGAVDSASGQAKSDEPKN